jgi:hypothetical protein
MVSKEQSGVVKNSEEYEAPNRPKMVQKMVILGANPAVTAICHSHTRAFYWKFTMISCFWSLTMTS